MYAGLAMTVLANLQFLRVVAALLVVAHHASRSMLEAFPALEPITLGVAGVDIFFILSGVVITLSHEHKSESRGAFLRARIIRIVPMYWLATLMLSLMLLVGLEPLGRAQADLTLGEIATSLLFIPHNTASGASGPLLLVGWTLNYEMFFYLLFGLFIALPPRGRVSATLFAILLLVLVGVLGLAGGKIATTYTDLILLEFAAGMLLGHYWANRRAGDRDRLIGSMFLALSLAGFALSTTSQAMGLPEPHRVVIWGIPGLFAVIGAMFLEAGGVAVRNRNLLLLGAASYVLYLFHQFVLQTLQKGLAAASVSLATPAGALLYLGLAVAISCLIAVGIHRKIEQPVTRFLKGGRTKAVSA
ncbi:acyltransferase family protein [Salipiger abyssi]|uniref:Exopolysaccharide production protein ExoZ n=1 Tax=Salipiger abyssi TaxID=1250539 RepID=A0A1P8UVW5_9RHOB|nr:acyltransferase [Salipiger abyssi]APZ53535.1 exopolysaccharide production protein ExoZ [Salipiger abyssi]